jgi:CRISPR-associated protein Cas2
VGKLSARVRDRLWERVTRELGPGRAVLVRAEANEQGYTVELAGWNDREVVDLDGFQLSRILKKGNHVRTTSY